MVEVLKKTFVLALAMAVVTSHTAFVVGDALAASRTMERAVVRAGSLCGKVVRADGEGVAGAVVTLSGPTGTVGTATTGEGGDFAGISIKAGTYTLAVDDRISLPLEVTEDSEISRMAIVLPTENYSAGATDDDDDDKGVPVFIKVAGGVLLVGFLIWGLVELTDSGSGSGDCP